MCSNPRYTQLAPRQLYPCLRIQRTLVMHPGAPSINWLARSCAFPITVVDVFAAAFVVFSCIQWLIGCKFKLCRHNTLWTSIWTTEVYEPVCNAKASDFIPRTPRSSWLPLNPAWKRHAQKPPAEIQVVISNSEKYYADPRYHHAPTYHEYLGRAP